MIIVNNDFSDLLSTFNAASVEYIVVGAHAVAAHGFFRFTRDLDVWVRPSPENARRVYAALAHFGAPLENLTLQDLTSDDLIYQIGVEPVRIDVITAIEGVDFETAWSNKVPAHYGSVPVFVLGRADLVRNKTTVGRQKDIDDVVALEKIGPIETE